MLSQGLPSSLLKSSLLGILRYEDGKFGKARKGTAVDAEKVRGFRRVADSEDKVLKMCIFVNDGDDQATALFRVKRW